MVRSASDIMRPLREQVVTKITVKKGHESFQLVVKGRPLFPLTGGRSIHCSCCLSSG